VSGNAFESGTRKAIPAVLIYVLWEDKVLMLHRDVQGRQDYHRGKWNGLGGKCEPDESFVQAACRELSEESGLGFPPERLRPAGFLQFPLFKAGKNEDWLVAVFTLRAEASELAGLKEQGPEGSLHWVPSDKILTLELWPGDREFLPWVLTGRPFLGTFWYREGELARSQMVPIG
jgi:8-oxo-dGTP diphosphatase